MCRASIGVDQWMQRVARTTRNDEQWRPLFPFKRQVAAVMRLQRVARGWLLRMHEASQRQQSTRLAAAATLLGAAPCGVATRAEIQPARAAADPVEPTIDGSSSMRQDEWTSPACAEQVLALAGVAASAGSPDTSPPVSLGREHAALDLHPSVSAFLRVLAVTPNIRSMLNARLKDAAQRCHPLPLASALADALETLHPRASEDHASDPSAATDASNQRVVAFAIDVGASTSHMHDRRGAFHQLILQQFDEALRAEADTAEASVVNLAFGGELCTTLSCTGCGRAAGKSVEAFQGLNLLAMVLPDLATETNLNERMLTCTECVLPSEFRHHAKPQGSDNCHPPAELIPAESPPPSLPPSPPDSLPGTPIHHPKQVLSRAPAQGVVLPKNKRPGPKKAHQAQAPSLRTVVKDTAHYESVMGARERTKVPPSKPGSMPWSVLAEFDATQAADVYKMLGQRSLGWQCGPCSNCFWFSVKQSCFWCGHPSTNSNHWSWPVLRVVRLPRVPVPEPISCVDAIARLEHAIMPNDKSGYPHGCDLLITRLSKGLPRKWDPLGTGHLMLFIGGPTFDAVDAALHIAQARYLTAMPRIAHVRFLPAPATCLHPSLIQHCTVRPMLCQSRQHFQHWSPKVYSGNVHPPSVAPVVRHQHAPVTTKPAGLHCNSNQIPIRGPLPPLLRTAPLATTPDLVNTEAGPCHVQRAGEARPCARATSTEVAGTSSLPHMQSFPVPGSRPRFKLDGPRKVYHAAVRLQKRWQARLSQKAWSQERAARLAAGVSIWMAWRGWKIRRAVQAQVAAQHARSTTLQARVRGILARKAATQRKFELLGSSPEGLSHLALPPSREVGDYKRSSMGSILQPLHTPVYGTVAPLLGLMDEHAKSSHLSAITVSDWIRASMTSIGVPGSSDCCGSPLTGKHTFQALRPCLVFSVAHDQLVRIERCIDLSNYVMQSAVVPAESTKAHYELYGAIDDSDASLLVYVKDIHGSWYMIHNATISVLDESVVLQSTATTLFYCHIGT